MYHIINRLIHLNYVSVTSKSNLKKYEIPLKTGYPIPFSIREKSGIAGKVADGVGGKPG
ncbi:MAG: hypothetical protein PHT07_12975 [Paludibacter sp.]|nr:hypothetical protein [Paludibacter sp.]